MFKKKRKEKFGGGGNNNKTQHQEMSCKLLKQRLQKERGWIELPTDKM